MSPAILPCKIMCKAYGDPEVYPLLLNSFIFGLGAAGLSVIFALALAWITIRTNAPFRTAL